MAIFKNQYTNEVSKIYTNEIYDLSKYYSKCNYDFFDSLYETSGLN